MKIMLFTPHRGDVNFKPLMGGIWHLFCKPRRVTFFNSYALYKTNDTASPATKMVHIFTFSLFMITGVLQTCTRAVKRPLFNLFYCVVVKISEVNRGVLPGFALLLRIERTRKAAMTGKP